MRVDTAEVERGLKDAGEKRVWGQLLKRPIERIALALVGVTAAIASMAEALILVVISLAGLRLSENSSLPVDLPFGLPLDELETSRLVGLGVAVLVARLFVLLGNAHVAARLSESVLYRLRTRLFRAYQGSSWETQSSLDEGYLQTLTQTYANRAATALQQLTRAVTAGTSFVTFVIGAILISPLGALALAGFGAGLFVLLRPFTKAIRLFAVKQKSAAREYARLLAEASSLSLEHRVFGAEAAVEQKLDAQLHRLAKVRTRQLALQSFTPNLYVGIGYLGILAGLGFATRLELSEVATLGAILLLMIRSLGYGQAFQTTSQTLAGAEPFLRDLFATVSSFEVDAGPAGQTDPGPLTSVSITNGTFERGDHVALMGIDFRIDAGESIGVIGPSGGGKSTLALALLRLIEPSDGRFTVNTSAASECSNDWWRKNVAFVPQAPVLFDGTVFENIALHRPEIGRDAALVAAVDAHLSSEIDSWPLGVDHPLGSRGANLSGGQRQRICIARALAGDPALLILDEPTSALDPEAEASIVDVLANLGGTRSIVVIAHRLSTLHFCDRVVRIEGGVLTELGSGKDLQRESPGA